MIIEYNQFIRQKHMHMGQADLVSDKEEVEYNNIIKRYRK